MGEISKPMEISPVDEDEAVPKTRVPMEETVPKTRVSMEETSESMEISPVEEITVPYASKFTWTVENFSRIDDHTRSQVFVAGGYQWQIILHQRQYYMDIYLGVADSCNLPSGWRRKAHFGLSLVDQLSDMNTVKRVSLPVRFYARQKEIGFKKFVPICDLWDENLGYVVNDRCVIEAEIEVHKDLVNYWTYDSKKETSFVGLKNQGATCYMNSLLQTLYNILCFRKAVYHMPMTENGGMPLALQSLFYKLQHKDRSVGTKALTKSFGWSSVDSFMQHDVQELNRVLCEKLEDKMKGTVVEGTIQNLFEGHHMNYIECINVDYKSTRKESFCDIQLDVKGCPDVYASFDKYVDVERMEGENRYHAEQHGLQDAKKGVLFVDFPPVLQLQLKRFEYDYTRDAMVKINDKYEFPLSLDLDRDNGKYLSVDSDRRIRNLYTLHSVLVHSGGVHGGHYYAFIRPTLADQWLKFDDDEVTKEEEKMAVYENYGGHTFFGFTKFSSAYMLVYIRDSDKDRILCDVDENDISEDLQMRLKKEKEERMQEKMERAEAFRYTTIKVAREEDMSEQIGKDIYFDLVDHDKVHSFRVEKKMPFKDFKELVSREFGVPVELLRFWQWAKRDNHTYRPGTPMTYKEELKSVGDLGVKVHHLFLEVGLGLSLPRKAYDDILLFCKLYDPQTKQLRYVGSLFVKSGGRPVQILRKLKEMAGFSPDEGIDIYEEVSFRPTIHCTPINMKISFHRNELEDGDIVCFQRSLTAEARKAFLHPDVPSFLEYVRNRKVVNFKSLLNPEADGISLELSTTFTYDEVMEKISSQLGLDDPTKIRLTSSGSSSPIKYRSLNKLSDMLRDASDTLTYEVLDVPLTELEDLKTFEIGFRNSVQTITLSKKSSVGDLILKLKEISNVDVRLLAVSRHRIFKKIPSSNTIENTQTTLLAEEIQEEEKNLGPNDHLVRVCHVTESPHSVFPGSYFGVPFMFAIREGETLLQIKERIKQRLQIEEEEFCKWKFLFITVCCKRYLEDSDDVSHFFRRNTNDIPNRSYFFRDENIKDWDTYIAIEHSNNTALEDTAMVEVVLNQNKKRPRCDMSVKICS